MKKHKKSKISINVEMSDRSFWELKLTKGLNFNFIKNS